MFSSLQKFKAIKWENVSIRKGQKQMFIIRRTKWQLEMLANILVGIDNGSLVESIPFAKSSSILSSVCKTCCACSFARRLWSKNKCCFPLPKFILEHQLFRFCISILSVQKLLGLCNAQCKISFFLHCFKFFLIIIVIKNDNFDNFNFTLSSFWIWNILLIKLQNTVINIRFVEMNAKVSASGQVKSRIAIHNDLAAKLGCSVYKDTLTAR